MHTVVRSSFQLPYFMLIGHRQHTFSAPKEIPRSNTMVTFHVLLKTDELNLTRDWVFLISHFQVTDTNLPKRNNCAFYLTSNNLQSSGDRRIACAVSKSKYRLSD